MKPGYYSTGEKIFVYNSGESVCLLDSNKSERQNMFEKVDRIPRDACLVDKNRLKSEIVSLIFPYAFARNNDFKIASKINKFIKANTLIN